MLSGQHQAQQWLLFLQTWEEQEEDQKEEKQEEEEEGNLLQLDLEMSSKVPCIKGVVLSVVLLGGGGTLGEGV